MAWIGLYSDQKKFVNLTARKQWACETEKLALRSFIARKNRQVHILHSQLAKARQALTIGLNKLNGDQHEKDI
jgi:gamma-glutamylcysteine synthetase